MKKTIAKTAALIMAAMLAGSVMPAAVYADYGVTATSDQSEKAMKEALTIVKKRITVPDELSEFNYNTYENYGTKVFNFQWYTPDDAKEYKSLEVSIVGDIITNYDFYTGKRYTNTLSFAKLSDAEILAKAEEHLKKLDPTAAGKIKSEISYIDLHSNTASVNFQRYENGVEVKDNSGRIVIDKDTGELINFSLMWMDNAKFSDPKTAKTEAEIKEAYKSLCNLTPYYKITTDWATKQVTTRIVYEPDMTAEIDAYTGKASTIWEDMRNAEGTRLSYVMYANTAAGAAYDEEAAMAEDGGVVFTEAELKKIQQDENLLTKEQVFELLKKDKFAALTDDFAISSYSISSGKTPELLINNEKGTASPIKDKEKENFYISATFKVKDNLKNSYKGYKSVYVNLDAETGEILYLSKYSNDSELPKLDLTKAKAVSDNAAKSYAKDIIKEYKADKSNSSPVQVWTSEVYSNGKKIQGERFETSRTFRYSRYVNNIQVYGDYIEVTVDSNGVVTGYSSNHTEAAFPSADDILTSDQAFEMLYKQKKFNYYYDGWVTKDGAVKTYLLYKMDNFYLNAKTGRICYWNGETMKNRVSSTDVKYTDIKGIPQEKAILTLQKYGILTVSESKFNPTAEIDEYEFRCMISSALGSYAVPYEADEEEAEKSVILTREGAALIFTQFYDGGGIANIKGIFRTPFSDVKSSDDNVGYIAVAYAKGFMKGEDGKFNGSRKITRAEAVQMIYDYILNISKS